MHQAKRMRLRDDFAYYAGHCLKIRSKSGTIVPFVLNAVQMRVHEAAERQRAATGRIRLLVLKARQPGISTYVEGRLYWKTSHRRGVRAFILTHRDQATRNLFAIAKRFHDHVPPAVRPQVKASNSGELEFGRLDSGYRVGTAKAEGVGRADTIQYFHGSEVAWWVNAEEHVAGALQAVPDEPDTEVWLESTANGIGGLFYNVWKAAERGEGAYGALFVPWFWHDEYRKSLEPGWRAPEPWRDYAAAHELAPEQLNWAYAKNAGMAAADGLGAEAPCWRFRQEYPASADEAFQASGHHSFIAPEPVARARRRRMPAQDHAPLVLGCDFARGARDRNWFLSRQGRELGGAVNEMFHSDDTEDIAGRLARIIDRARPDACFLDSGGGGAAVFDILKARGYGRLLTLVNFGGSARDARRYANKRAEMWGELRDWLIDPGGAAIPDDDALHAEICAPGYAYNANQQIVLEPKDKIRARLGFSTDGGDAAALTFAERVRAAPRHRPASAESAYDPHAW